MTFSSVRSFFFSLQTHAGQSAHAQLTHNATHRAQPLTRARTTPISPHRRLSCCAQGAATAVGEWQYSEKGGKITDSSSFAHVANLPPASWHDFRIRAHNAVGYSEWSEVSTKVRTDDAPYLVKKDARSITLRWTAQKRALHYEMQVQEPSFPDGTWVTVNTRVPGSTYTVDKLFPANEYRFRIRAFFPKKNPDDVQRDVQGQQYGWASYEGSATSRYIRTDDALPDAVDPPCLLNAADILRTPRRIFSHFFCLSLSLLSHTGLH